MLAVDNSYELPTAHTFAHKLHSHRLYFLTFISKKKAKKKMHKGKNLVAHLYDLLLAFS